VSLDDWVLALHVVSAFVFVGGVAFFWVLLVAVRQADTPEGTLRLVPLARVADATVAVGAMGTIVLGIWLAFSVGGYDIWDAWIVAAIVLWFVITAFGRRLSAAQEARVKKARELQEGRQTGPSSELVALNRTSSAIVVQVLASAVLLLILIDMIWKPDA
jgi:uncharacterized membrane protein